MPEKRKARAMRSAPRHPANPAAVSPRLAVALLAFYQLLNLNNQFIVSRIVDVNNQLLHFWFQIL